MKLISGEARTYAGVNYLINENDSKVLQFLIELFDNTESIKNECLFYVTVKY